MSASNLIEAKRQFREAQTGVDRPSRVAAMIAFLVVLASVAVASIAWACGVDDPTGGR